MADSQPAGLGGAEVTSGEFPFRWWVVDAPGVPEDYLSCVPPPEWDGWEARYDNDLERGKRTTRRFGGLGEPLASRLAEFFRPESVSWWRELTGIEGLQSDPTLHGAGLHCSSPGSWLQVHADYEIHPKLTHLERRLNVIAFLNPEWESGWGGELLLCDGNGEPYRRVLPRPGRLFAFECGPVSFHGVMQTTRSAPDRVTAANYFLAPVRPWASRPRAMFFPNRSGEGIPPREVRRDEGNELPTL